MIPVVYNVRSLLVRRTTTAATVLGIAVVAFLFACVQMFANGLRTSLGRAAARDVAVVLRRGATTGRRSIVDERRLNLLRDMPEVSDMRIDLVRVVRLPRRAGGVSYVLLRGVSANGAEFGPELRIVEGRPASPGSDEAVVGRSVAGKYAGLAVGESFDLPRARRVTVVGVFEAGGSILESEVWTSIDTLRAAYGTEGRASAARVRLKDASQVELFGAAVSRLDDDLAVVSEQQHYVEQSRGMGSIIHLVALVVVGFFSLAAAFGAAITMHASVAGRRREIGVLRSLGFSRYSILTTFLVECAVLGCAGGLLGGSASVAMSQV